jgi:hypothetical protein
MSHKKQVSVLKNNQVVNLEFAVLKQGMSFSEECVIFPKCTSQYTVTVSSDSATILSINEFEFTKKIKT